MTLTALFLSSIAVAFALFKLGALALSGMLAAQGAFSPRGLLVPARSGRR